jgi:hypothetical protein
MIYAGTPKEIETRRKSFIRKWRRACQESCVEGHTLAR